MTDSLSPRLRFHGIKQWYRHDYTKDEITIWADRIRASDARGVWAYFNNDRDGYAIKNARVLLRMLKNLSNEESTISRE